MSELAPMKVKPYSVDEVVRDAALALSPLKLAVAFAVLLPFFFVGQFLTDLVIREWGGDKAAPYIISILEAIPALGAILAVLLATYISRIQLEGQKLSIGGIVNHLIRGGPAAIALSLLFTILWFVFKGILLLIGAIRNASEATATIIRFLKVAPLLTSALMVLIAVCGAIVVLYFLSAMAVEGSGALGAFKQLRATSRGQLRRIAWHSFLIAFAWWGAVVISGYLVARVCGLPDAVFPSPDSAAITREWNDYWVVGAFYDKALVEALTLFLPLSLLGTFGVLSYAALRTREGGASSEAPKA